MKWEKLWYACVYYYLQLIEVFSFIGYHIRGFCECQLKYGWKLSRIKMCLMINLSCLRDWDLFLQILQEYYEKTVVSNYLHDWCFK